MDTTPNVTTESDGEQGWTKVDFTERERMRYSFTPSGPTLKQRHESTPGSFPANDPIETAAFSSGNVHSQSPPMNQSTTPASGGATPNEETTTGSAGSAAGANPPPRPRKCRICFEIVHPKVAPATMPSVPGLAPQPPRWEYVSDESPELGRLISPCKCRGSSKYVHEGCLQTWRMTTPSMDRNYWKCPTCNYCYRLDRLKWAKYVQSVPSQLTLTFVVFIIAMFVMGFIADPIINIYLDPWSIFNWGWSGASPMDPLDNLFDDDESAGGWFEHFFKGMASLGVVGFLKFMVMSPFQYYRLRLPGGNNGGRTTGRDRMENLSWIVILLGIGTTLYGIYTAVRAFSRRALMRTAERVLDVGDDGNNDDDDDDNGNNE